MKPTRAGQIAVIFRSLRTDADDAGYATAAQAMECLAAKQPGFCGIVSARSADGEGITVSYWADDAAAQAWRDQPDHAAIRDRGRAVWYSDYDVQVARIERGYGWSKS